ncbi:serine protease Do [Singulisphaera sp. GP187]|uniref:S1C family serine protease n=1 Tax=Singulisphaera sp. GP187 TaxID=1882752 RepID=UPI000928D535|nr:trypsin-like peptidase domain-containing protein [Singulisphaera sp. GP187]SIO12831.1 serine protease Do [Singulisphaera sp. GP187]
MRLVVPVAVTVLVGLFSCGAHRGGAAEVIGLKDGHEVTGEVVAEKPNALYVDLGFDILRIPRDQVVRRGKPGAADPATLLAHEPETEASGFFTLGPLRPAPVKELVAKFGEAVVSIETPSGKGSGFIINDDGYAVTNHHVIHGETRISAVLYQNVASGLARRRIENVEIVALNPFVDLALLKLPAQKDLKLSHVVLGSLDDLNAGDGVFAVGNPLGLERSVSQGIVSTRNRNFEGQIYLQTDAAINPGNSGGPLFNLRGEVIGVTNMKATQGDNLGFAIPIYYVKDFLRNRDAFSFDKENPNTGYRYLDPPRRLRVGDPPRALEVSAQEKVSATGAPERSEVP